MTASAHTIPETMKAIEISNPGGPEVLKPVTRPVPTPSSGCVLIKVEAAGVNRPDCLQRAGLYPPPPGASDLPGLEVCGTVVALGEGVDRSMLGTKVTALTPGGGYAQYCTAPVGSCLPVPASFTAIEAASLPETFFTVWVNVFDRLKLQAGETFLVHGGSSGIGTTAIQLAKAFGAKVATTAGSAEKVEYCKGLGADLAINYREQDWKDIVSSEFGGVDVILDMVGGSYIQKGIDILNPDGRYGFIAFLEGAKAEVNFRNVLTNRLSISGSTLRPRPDEVKAGIARSLKEKVWPLLESGRVKTMVSETFPLEQAAEAHALMEGGKLMGKIVLKVS